MTVDELAAQLDARGLHYTPDRRVTELVAAEILGSKPKTLANWRHKAVGPPWISAGKVWYRLDALLDWLRRRERGARC